MKTILEEMSLNVLKYLSHIMTSITMGDLRNWIMFRNLSPGNIRFRFYISFCLSSFFPVGYRLEIQLVFLNNDAFEIMIAV